MNRASLQDVRIKNKELIKKVIFENPNISRVELAELSGLSGGTITNLVTELLKSGEIIESKEMESTGGRRRTGLLVNNREGDILVFEAKQRHLTCKRYDINMTLLETKIAKMNYINGNFVVEFILETIKLLDKEPVKIGLLVEENISEADISFMLSTGISQENIPIKDALKMYLKQEVEIEYSSKYILEEEILNNKLENISNYIYASLDFEMTAQVYMNGEIVKHSGHHTLYLTEVLSQIELLDKWREAFGGLSSLKQKQLTEGKPRNPLTIKKSPIKLITEITASVLAIISVFYKLDAIFIVGKASNIEGIDRDIYKLLDKKLENNKIRLVQVIQKNDGEYSDKMVKKLAENYIFN